MGLYKLSYIHGARLRTNVYGTIYIISSHKYVELEEEYTREYIFLTASHGRSLIGGFGRRTFLTCSLGRALICGAVGRIVLISAGTSVELKEEYIILINRRGARSDLWSLMKNNHLHSWWTSHRCSCRKSNPHQLTNYRRSVEL